MANTTLTQTGAEVQADLDKVEGLANVKTIGSGLSLSAGGELSASGGGGTQLYKHHFTLINDDDVTVELELITIDSTPYTVSSNIDQTHVIASKAYRPNNNLLCDALISWRTSLSYTIEGGQINAVHCNVSGTLSLIFSGDANPISMSGSDTVTAL